MSWFSIVPIKNTVNSKVGIFLISISAVYGSLAFADRCTENVIQPFVNQAISHIRAIYPSPARENCSINWQNAGPEIRQNHEKGIIFFSACKALKTKDSMMPGYDQSRWILNGGDPKFHVVDIAGLLNPIQSKESCEYWSRVSESLNSSTVQVPTRIATCGDIRIVETGNKVTVASTTHYYTFAFERNGGDCRNISIEGGDRPSSVALPHKMSFTCPFSSLSLYFRALDERGELDSKSCTYVPPIISSSPRINSTPPTLGHPAAN